MRGKGGYTGWDLDPKESVMTTAAKRVQASFCRRGNHLGCASAKAVCGCSCHVERVKPPPDPKPRSDAAKARHAKRREGQAALVRPWIAKELRPCCAATKDAYGRYCIGWCGPDCLGRPKRDDR